MHPKQMQDNDSDNIFDKDDALDNILFQDVDRQGQRMPPSGKGGCLGLLVVFLLGPAPLGYALFSLFR